MNISHNKIIGLSIGTLVLVAVATAGIYSVLPKAQSPMIQAGAIGLPPIVTDYEPQSAWMEEGLNPDEMQLDLTEPDPSAASTAPVWQDIDGIIRQHVHTRYNDMMPCYARALEDQDIQGRVDIRFGVAADGHVALVKVTHSELRSPETEDCLVEVARAWRFPATGRANLTQFDSDFRFSYE